MKTLKRIGLFLKLKAQESWLVVLGLMVFVILCIGSFLFDNKIINWFTVISAGLLIIIAIGFVLLAIIVMTWALFDWLKSNWKEVKRQIP